MITRRLFLERVGQVGGTAAVYQAMTALGMLAGPAEAASGPFALDGPSGKGTKVLILGAGLAGMNTAYELGKRGYECQILEARNRPGGRCHTIRGGTVETELDGTRQVCQFDKGLYINPGPARIPQHHVTLDYCRELNVAIEPFAQVNEAAYYYHENVGALSGQRIRVRETKADLYGYTAELLAKAVSQTSLDLGLTAQDKERLLDFLASDGSISRGDWRYGRSDRAGYRIFPGAGEALGAFDEPRRLHDLLEAGFGRHFAEDYPLNWQMMMFQMVGGNDNLPRAFARKLGRRITYNAVVTEIRQGENGVRVVYTQGKDTRTATADFCVCAIPISILKDIPGDFSKETARAIAGISYAPTGKIGIQFKRRFWEEDDRIFGGITRTNLPITQIFYPSTGFLGQKGVLVGYYNFGTDAETFGALPPAERTARALTEGVKIHPQYRAEYENAFSIAWERVPYTKGGWAAWDDVGRRDLYPILNRADGRIYFAGEHLSYLTGWMAGALESARLVSRAIHQRAANQTRKAPSS